MAPFASIFLLYYRLFVNLYQFGYSRLKEISLSSAIILTTAGLFLSFSRTALLGAGLGLFFLSFVHLKKWRRLLLSFFFIIATAGLLFYNYGQLYYTRFEPLTGISTASVVDRKTYIQESFSLIKKHPLFGVGAGNYGLALNQAVDKKINSYYYQPVHNFWLMLFTEIGLFGLICIVFLFFKLIIDSLKNLKQAREAKLIVACLLLTFAISLFDHWLWSLHFGVLFFWTIIGLSIKTLAK
jgi:O-antigen ligase